MLQMAAEYWIGDENKIFPQGFKYIFFNLIFYIT